jgi:nicotinate-nucleotide adenylyltransferase
VPPARGVPTPPPEAVLTASGSGSQRIGLLGGTFNPPHLGHLVCAQEALVQLGLDRVLLMPAHLPPHKTVEADPGVAHRVAMCEAAAAPDPRLGVCLVEVRRGGASYTVDTLRALHAEAPGDELTFIVGGDMAHSLPTWREPEAVLSLATLAVARREELSEAAIVAELAGLDGVPHRLRFFNMPRLDISSSLIRRRVAAGLPVRYLVPDGVADHIARESLYRSTALAIAGGQA